MLSDIYPEGNIFFTVLRIPRAVRTTINESITCYSELNEEPEVEGLSVVPPSG